VIGAKVHDARLVAAMNVHGARRLLTFNAGDFTRLRDRSGAAGCGAVLKTVTCSG
jgi:hypothetical protein